MKSEETVKASSEEKKTSGDKCRSNCGCGPGLCPGMMIAGVFLAGLGLYNLGLWLWERFGH